MAEKNSVVRELYKVVEDRRNNPIEGSYTNYLFEKGIDKILKKIGEESSEVIIASKNTSKSDLVGEMCDLIYHMIVLMVDRDVKIDDIIEELEMRRKKICNKKTEKKINGFD